jgi:hypothetical protein
MTTTPFLRVVHTVGLNKLSLTVLNCGLEFRELCFRQLRPVRASWAILRELSVEGLRIAFLAGRRSRAGRPKQSIKQVGRILQHDSVLAQRLARPPQLPSAARPYAVA